MIDLILASVIHMTPIPMQDPAIAAHIANVQAARQARDIPDKWQPFALCISARESGFGRHPDTRKSYQAANPASSAQGRYQFLDSSWRKGGAWNVWKRLRAHGYDKQTAAKVRNRLMLTPIKAWKPVYQDILFAYVITSTEGKGWRHWHLAGSPCNRLVPS